ncbi:acetaldehyde dehydrogenase (acetylating) [Phycicoccus sp.]|uniref:acetaldehyde dehydrogenase (acetylating) n=1 Tax=Phycicoccus sp. TaxID=1902410 RepID=UPI002C0C4F47|nr:acetaldehyde dehydrogenase (acetylating) [Phycicoccus sp.]HMM95996.1 acetaldehyde dehydrogenase (acetylating) [Phycicoccus sp.]
MRCAIVGSGNIGTDLMVKLMRAPGLELGAVVGIDPDSDGLRTAREAGLETSHEGADWLIAHADDFDVVFEATSAWVMRRNAPRYEEAGLRVVDLTPAKLGPLVVPPVNGHEHRGAQNVNLITCGGQATVPMVAAVNAVCPVPYAEIVSSVSSRSAGPGTRQNIDEFTKTTSDALVTVGGAARGKAIMVLNPADPPILMRNTVFCALPDGYDEAAVTASVTEMVARVAEYVPGYRLKNEPVFEREHYRAPGGDVGARVVILLEVEGAGDWFPPYAGNLDIMTASAVRVGTAMAEHRAGAPA